MKTTDIKLFPKDKTSKSSHPAKRQSTCVCTNRNYILNRPFTKHFCILIPKYKTSESISEKGEWLERTIWSLKL